MCALKLAKSELQNLQQYSNGIGIHGKVQQQIWCIFQLGYCTEAGLLTVLETQGMLDIITKGKA